MGKSNAFIESRDPAQLSSESSESSMQSTNLNNPLDDACITLTPNTSKKDSCCIKDQRFISKLDPVQKSVLTIGNDLNRLMKIHESISLEHNLHNLHKIHDIFHAILTPYTDMHEYDVPQEINYD